MGRPTRPGPSKSICEAATSRWGARLFRPRTPLPHWACHSGLLGATPLAPAHPARASPPSSAGSHSRLSPPVRTAGRPGSLSRGTPTSTPPASPGPAQPPALPQVHGPDLRPARLTGDRYPPARRGRARPGGVWVHHGGVTGLTCAAIMWSSPLRAGSMSQSRGDTNATVMRRARTPRDGRHRRLGASTLDLGLGEGAAPESGYNQFVEELVNHPDFGYSVGGNGQSTEFYSCSNTHPHVLRPPRATPRPPLAARAR